VGAFGHTVGGALVDTVGVRVNPNILYTEGGKQLFAAI